MIAGRPAANTIRGAGCSRGSASTTCGIMTVTKAKVVMSADLRGREEGGKVALAGRGWKGRAAAGKLTAEGKGGKFVLERLLRKSPTELAPPPAGALVLLPYAKGKPTSLAAWTNPKWPLLSDGSAMVRGGTNLSRRKFSNFKMHLEFRARECTR